MRRIKQVLLLMGALLFLTVGSGTPLVASGQEDIACCGQCAITVR